MSGKLNRRRFLKASAAAAGAGYFVVADIAESRALWQNAPANRLNIAIIGAGGQGSSNLQSINSLGTENIVALCDVDHNRAASNFAKFDRAAKYQDYRVMLDKQKDIDAV